MNNTAKKIYSALDNPLASVVAEKAGLRIVRNPITVGLNTPNQKNVVRFDAVNESGVTVKTYGSMAAAFNDNDILDRSQIDKVNNESMVGTLYKATASGQFVRYELDYTILTSGICPLQTKFFNTLSEAKDFMGKPLAAPT